MSGLSIGLSTFNSCNKAGSIPHFTRHLARYPEDYQALIWRGRAYSIIGKFEEAKADFQKAYRISHGPQKCLAQAHIVCINGNMQQKAAILQYTTKQYPDCSEAWHDLGGHTYHFEKKVDLALKYLLRAIQLAATTDPWYPWCNLTIGDIYFYEKQQVNSAKLHYTKAVESSNTLTVGHLGLSRCNILENNLDRAEKSFLEAKNHNPELVLWKTFEHFRRQVQFQHKIGSVISDFLKVFSEDPNAQESPSSFEHLSGATSVAPSLHQQQKSPTQDRKTVSGLQEGKSRRSRGRDGSGDESSSEDEDLTSEQSEKAWKKIRDEAPRVMKYRGKTFYQSICKTKWYSKIKATERHGRVVQSFLKVYKDRKNHIELIGSIDQNMKFMPEKHESGKLKIIKISDMNACHIKNPKK